jgi:hypothetical protein
MPRRRSRSVLPSPKRRGFRKARASATRIWRNGPRMHCNGATCFRRRRARHALPLALFVGVSCRSRFGRARASSACGRSRTMACSRRRSWRTTLPPVVSASISVSKTGTGFTGATPICIVLCRTIWPRDAAALSATAAAVNILIYTQPPPENRGFAPRQCFSRVCIAERPGTCAASPMASLPLPKPFQRDSAGLGKSLMPY